MDEIISGDRCISSHYCYKKDDTYFYPTTVLLLDEYKSIYKIRYNVQLTMFSNKILKDGRFGDKKKSSRRITRANGFYIHHNYIDTDILDCNII